MDYWNKLSEKYNAMLISTKEIITADTSPVTKIKKDLNWSNDLGDISIEYLHSEHARSFNNSTYSKFSINLSSASNLEFKFSKVDFLEKIYAKVLKGKKVIFIHNFIVESNSLKRAEQIMKHAKIHSNFIESIELNSQTPSTLTIVSAENLMISKNAEIYIELLIEITNQLPLKNQFKK
jgi:hypothetical protein